MLNFFQSNEDKEYNNCTAKTQLNAELEDTALEFVMGGLGEYF